MAIDYTAFRTEDQEFLARELTEDTALTGAPSTSPMGIGMCGLMLIGHGTRE